MLVTFLYKSKNKKIFVSLLKAQTYCNSLGFFLKQKYLLLNSNTVTGNVTDLKFLGESVGGLELHDMLHKLLHCQRLVTIWNTRLNINYILVTSA